MFTDSVLNRFSYVYRGVVLDRGGKGAKRTRISLNPIIEKIILCNNIC